MLLIVTNSQDATADHLVHRLQRGGIEFLRFDTDRSLDGACLSYKGGLPSLAIEGAWYRPGDFENIWYRRPEPLRARMIDRSPEGKFALTEWSEALEGFLAHVPQDRWMNHPAKNVAASHKIEQLTTAAELGLRVPETLVTQDSGELKAFFQEHGGRIIVKPMAIGSVERPEGEASSLIYTNRVTDRMLEQLEDLKVCPTLFQRYVDKARDIRITIVDREMFAVAMLAQDEDGSQRCDIRRNDMDDVLYARESLPYDVASSLKLLMERYGLRFAAIDMVVDRAGSWHFLEVNPNGQWAWLDGVVDVDISMAFVRSFGG